MGILGCFRKSIPRYLQNQIGGLDNMKYEEFYEALSANKLIAPIWKEVLPIISNELDDNQYKENFMVLFTIMFSLLDDGNVCMSLKEDVLKKRWFTKLEGKKILLDGEEELDKEQYDKAYQMSKEVIEASLKDMTVQNLIKVVAPHKFFEIEDDWIYIRKDNVARKSLLNSIDRLFSKNLQSSNTFDYRKVMNTDKEYKGKKLSLKPAQQEVVNKGLTKNLIITGGPGTGKTTSIFYLLVGLMLNHKYNKVYLLAPSGKAASQMKTSISGEQKNIREDFYDKNKDLVDNILNLDRSTIHKALGVDLNTGAFKHNENYKFEENSIFIIDEASMIDICLFASLLKAIPDDGRVFIMGDKDQLPSVDSGSVFADLLNKQSLIDNGNIVRLTETIRFEEGSPVYNLAQEVNADDGKDITTIKESSWMKDELTIQEHDSSVVNPVYAFLNPSDEKEQKKAIKAAITAFGEKYYANLQEQCINLTEQTDFSKLYSLTVQKASILSAENNGIRGVKAINSYIKDKFIKKDILTPVAGFYPGELMMINKNNKLLDLSNGDSGVLVMFKDDKTLYFMIEKDSDLIKNEGKYEGKIFKLGKCIFYPFSMITRSEIDNSFAITIHKSQGSGYNNILIILPVKEGHPLLNRQILYTAITRTKGDTYILSSQRILNFAKKTVLTRDTNI